MMDFIYGNSEYPEEALYIERLAPESMNGNVTYEGAVPFYYRNVRSSSQKEQQVQGLKSITYMKTIRTKATLPFEAKDKIKIGEKVYSIRSAETLEDERYAGAKMFFNVREYETEIILE